MNHGPFVRVPRSHVPSARPSHGESHQGDATLVDAILLLDCFDCFQDVGFPGRLVADALTAERMKDDAVLDGELTRLGHALFHEMKVGDFISPPV